MRIQISVEWEAKTDEYEFEQISSCRITMYSIVLCIGVLNVGRIAGLIGDESEEKEIREIEYTNEKKKYYWITSKFYNCTI